VFVRQPGGLLSRYRTEPFERSFGSRRGGNVGIGAVGEVGAAAAGPGLRGEGFGSAFTVVASSHGAAGEREMLSSLHSGMEDSSEARVEVPKAAASSAVFVFPIRTGDLSGTDEVLANATAGSGWAAAGDDSASPGGRKATSPCSGVVQENVFGSTPRPESRMVRLADPLVQRWTSGGVPASAGVLRAYRWLAVARSLVGGAEKLSFLHSPRSWCAKNIVFRTPPVSWFPRALASDHRTGINDAQF
jgi:hypothetical protein